MQTDIGFVLGCACFALALLVAIAISANRSTLSRQARAAREHREEMARRYLRRA